MTFDELVEVLRPVTSVWGLKSVGVQNLQSGLADAAKRMRQTETRVAQLEARLNALTKKQEPLSNIPTEPNQIKK